MDIVLPLFIRPTATRRALPWILVNAHQLWGLCRTVQAGRRAKDGELMRDFMASLVRTEGPARDAANRLAACSCHMLRLASIEKWKRAARGS